MALREILAHFGVDVDTEELEKADKAVDNFIDRLKGLGTALIGGEFAKQVVEFGERIAEQGEQLEKASVRLGISTDALQALGYAAVQSGSDMGQLTFALLTLQDKIGDALVNKGGEGSKTFAKLGISIKDANGHVKDAGDLLETVADRVAKAKTQAEKTSIAMQAFGRQGKSLLPLLEGGSAGIKAYREEFEALGGGIREDAIKASSKYITTLGKLHAVHDGLTGQISVVLLPVLDRMIDVLTHVERDMINVAKSSSTVQVALGGLGAILVGFAIKSAIAFAPWIAWAAALGAIFLVIEDFVTMMRGGDSAIGRLIDALFGKNAHVSAVESIAEAWKAMFKAIKDAGPYIKSALEFLDKAEDRSLDFQGRLGDLMFDAEKYREGKDSHGESDVDSVGNRDRFNQAAMLKEAQRYRNMSPQERKNYVPSFIPSEYAQTQDQKNAFSKAIVTMAARLNKGGSTVSVPFVGATGTTPGAVVHQKNEFHIHDAQDPHKTAKVVHEVIKDRTAAAKHVLHKKVVSQ